MGSSSLTEKRKLEGRHWVYNITVANTHNYLVGTEGFLVHNDCGDLDVLATKFMQNFSPQLKKLRIAEWCAKKGPIKGGDINDSFFGRGRFFERLVRKSKFASWKWTNDLKSNFKAIDFYKKEGIKNIVGSLKSTKSNPSEWLNYNKDHLKELIKIAKDKKIIDGKQLDADEVFLFITVPHDKLGDWSNFSTTLLNSGLPDINKIKLEIFSMENVLRI